MLLAWIMRLGFGKSNSRRLPMRKLILARCAPDARCRDEQAELDDGPLDEGSLRSRDSEPSMLKGIERHDIVWMQLECVARLKLRQQQGIDRAQDNEVPVGCDHELSAIRDKLADFFGDRGPRSRGGGTQV